jgi:hypothetical protein
MTASAIRRADDPSDVSQAAGTNSIVLSGDVPVRQRLF